MKIRNLLQNVSPCHSPESRNDHSARFTGFEPLETRLCPAVIGIIDGLSDTLTLTQVSDDGAILIDDNGADDAIRVVDGAGLLQFDRTDNLIVQLMDNSNEQLVVDLGVTLEGSAAFDLGNGARTVDFIGLANAFFMNLSIDAGTGVQSLNLDGQLGLMVGGDLDIDLGDGDDPWLSANPIVVGANLSLVGVNTFQFFGGLDVDGDFTMDTTGEMVKSTFQEMGSVPSQVGGQFLYRGGNAVDDVYLNDVLVQGDLDVDLGSGITTDVDSQDFEVFSNGGVLGTTTVTSQISSVGDDILFYNAATFGDDLFIDLGNGTNQVVFRGDFAGSTIVYRGGAGADSVDYHMMGSPAQVDLDLGLGPDRLTLNTTMASLVADFGNNNDQFVNNLGAPGFDIDLLGLEGFDHYYRAAQGHLTSMQLDDRGSLRIDNNGAGNAIRFDHGGLTSLMPVTHLEVTLIDGSGVEVGWDQAFVGDFNLDLGSGDRLARFVGANNSIGGDLTVVAGAGDQTVELAVTAGLTVDGETRIQLGTGDDRIDGQGRDLNLNGVVLLKGINDFVNEGVFSTGDNVTFNVTFEDQPTLLQNLGEMTIGGELRFLGGPNVDQVLLGGTGVWIGGGLHANLGGNLTGQTQRVRWNADDTEIHGGLTVLASGADGTDVVEDAPHAELFGEIVVKPGDGTNEVHLAGMFYGDSLLYRGGAGIDNVEYAVSGPGVVDANFVLGTGDDTVILGSAPMLAHLRVDFGGGGDSFENALGRFDYSANLLNLDGFNRMYDLASDTLTFRQIADLGDATLGNGNPGQAWNLAEGSAALMTPAANVVVFMKHNSNSNLNVNIEAAVLGGLKFELGAGHRELHLSNSGYDVEGDVRVLGNGGDQQVFVHAAADFEIDGLFSANLKGGLDRLVFTGESVRIDGNLNLMGTNILTNESDVTVEGNFALSATEETRYSMFENNGRWVVFGGFSYVGGSEVDKVVLNGQTHIGGDSYINLGNGYTTTMQSQRFVANGNSLFEGDLVFVSGNGNEGNLLFTSDDTQVFGQLKVNNGGVNTGAIALNGFVAGDVIDVRGSTAGDAVTLNIDADGADAKILLFEGNDHFVLGPDTELFSLIVNFGEGQDTFDDQLGQPYPFPVDLVNLP